MLHEVTNQTGGSILLGPWDRSYVFKGTFHCETPSFKNYTYITSVSSSMFHTKPFPTQHGSIRWPVFAVYHDSYRLSLSRATINNSEGNWILAEE